MYDKLIAKINNIDTSAFVLKTEHNTDKSDLEKKVMQTKRFLIVVGLLKNRL